MALITIIRGGILLEIRVRHSSDQSVFGLSTWQRTRTNIYFQSRLSWNDLPNKSIRIIEMPSLTLHYINGWWLGCAHLLRFFRLLTASHLSPPFLTSFSARVQAPVDPRKFYPSSVCRRPATNGFAMCSEITYLRATATKTSSETYKMAYRQQITLTCIFWAVTQSACAFL